MNNFKNNELVSIQFTQDELLVTHLLIETNLKAMVDGRRRFCKNISDYETLLNDISNCLSVFEKVSKKIDL